MGRFAQKSGGVAQEIKPILALLFIFALLIGVNSFAQQSGSAALFGSSFSEKKTVPKKIFAKALSAYLQIPAASDGKCFSDIKESDENAPAICALKKRKIIPDHSKQKFLGNSKVTFEYAVKTLCRAKKWTKKKTFKACKAWAKESGYFEEPFPQKIASKKKLLYPALALLMDRSAETAAEETKSAPAVTPPEPAETDNETSAAIPPREILPLTSNPFPEVAIGANFFANIALKESLPNHFYKDEVRFIEGDVTGITASEVFVFLCPDKLGCDKSVNFLEKTAGNHFRIPVLFRETGNFQMGIIPGRAGQSRVENISVLPEPSEAQTGNINPPSDLSAGYAQGKTAFRWKKGGGTQTRLIIFQGNKRKDYFFRQDVTSYTPSSKDFKGFSKGKAFWVVQEDKILSSVKEISLTTQEFRKIKEDEIQVKSLTETLESGKIVLEGKSLAPISKRAAVTLPSGFVKEIILGDSDIPAGRDINIEFPVDALGTYIFEVNNPEGAAVINVPVYVNGRIPLLPDFFALDEPELDTSPIDDLTEARKNLLQLINADRDKHSLPPVILNDDLNKIAQNHSLDMVERNFFGHVNPSGKSPDDRRKAASLPVAIRENLGKAASLGAVEAGLMRSPVHREVILDSELTRVGLGIAKDSEGYIIATQNFSTDPLTLSVLPRMEDELFDTANAFRGGQSLALIAHDAALRDIARLWSNRMGDGGFFKTTDPATGERLTDILRNRGIQTAIQIHIIKTNDKAQLKEQLLKQIGLQDPANSKIGIGLGVDALGDLAMTVIYTP